MDAETHRRDVERWRARRLDRLTAPDGWLTLVGLDWLREGENLAPGGAGTITLEDGVATLQADPGAGVTHEGRPVASLVLRDDREGDPTIVRRGTLTFHVISREGRLGVRIKDAESPVRRAFEGIVSYPVDLRWRLEAGFEPFDPPREAPVPNVLGFEETMAVPGALRFEVDGAPHRLLAFTETGTRDLFIVFGDRTNEDETYPGGRYLYAAPPKTDGLAVVDFNKAYNPPCAFTPYATCVLPPAGEPPPDPDHRRGAPAGLRLTGRGRPAARMGCAECLTNPSHRRGG